MRKKAEKINVSYEPEADVLSWEISDKPIDYAKEAGNVIVHFSKNNTPVFIELLEASKFFTQTKRLIHAQRADEVAR